MVKILQILVIIILLIFPLVFSNQYIHHVITLCLIYSIASIGWNLSYGYAGLLSFGHSAYFGIGAYIPIMLIRSFGLTPWVGIFVGSTVAAVFGMSIAWLTARTRGVHFSLCTQAIPPVLFVLFTWRAGWWGEFTGGSYGVSVPYKAYDPFFMQWDYTLPYYYISFIFVMASIWTVMWITKTKFGYYLIALGEDEDAANSLGINILRIKILGMGISTFITGLAGGMYANFIHFIDPYEAFGAVLNLQFILAGMMGGVRTVIGPVFGAFLLVPFSEFVKVYLEQRFGYGLIGAHFIFYGIVLMILINIIPEGIYPKIKDSLTRFKEIKR